MEAYIYIHIYIFIYTSKYTNVHALNKGEQLVVSNRAIGLADFFLARVIMVISKNSEQPSPFGG
jgi:ABC-type metal ion transport system substrate-binding protein